MKIRVRNTSGRVDWISTELNDSPAFGSVHVDHLLRAPHPVVFGYVWDLGTKIKERRSEKEYRKDNEKKREGGRAGEHG